MGWDRIERLIGLDNLQRLAQKRVGIIGLGSGGGFAAQSLAMSGIGKFVLVDADILEESNVVRHVCDRRDIGKPKVEAVADMILQRNPKADLETRFGKIEDNLDALDNLDILIVGVDGENAKYTINQACLARNLTAVYAGVYERGEGGDTVIIRPYDGPCYACWAAELRDGLSPAINDTDQTLDYGMIGPSGTLEAEPGLWLHVVRVAAVQTDLALNELLRGSKVAQTLPGNTLIMANRTLEIVDGHQNQPHTALWVMIERDPDCFVCGTTQTTALSLDDLSDETGLIEKTP